MALFEQNTKSSGEYVALLDAEGSLVAFISPVKQVKPETLLEALKSKGLNVEVRQSSAEMTTVVL